LVWKLLYASFIDGTTGGGHDNNADADGNHGALKFAAPAASNLVRTRMMPRFMVVVHLSLLVDLNRLASNRFTAIGGQL
jgi:hypothetical protein